MRIVQIFVLISIIGASIATNQLLESKFNALHGMYYSWLQKKASSDPNQWTPCQSDIAQLINETYPNSDLLLLYSGLGPFELGLYDECQTVSNAHYCLLTYEFPSYSTFPINTGLCLPLNCTNDDVDSFIYFLLDEVSENGINVTAHCAKKTWETPDWNSIVVFTFISFLGFLAIVGGIIEYWIEMKKKEMKPAAEEIGLLGDAKMQEYNEENLPKYTRFFLAFSPITNFKKLLVPTSVPHLASLNGLRTFSMLWVILGHSAYWGTFTTGYDNAIFVRYQVLQRWTSQMMLNAPYSVDAFFYMSGFLVAYLSQKELAKKKRLNMFLYYFHRFWRLTPPYMIALLILWKCLPYFGSGPFWFQVDGYISRTACHKYWWTNLLYINNFLPPDYDTTCMGWSWYLANDMQLYILTPIFIWSFYKSRIIGWILLSVFSIGSLLANFVIVYVDHYTPYVPEMQIDDSYESVVYSKFYTRGIAWLIGIAGAWVLYEWEKKPRKLHWIGVVILYAIAGFLLASTVFGTQDLYQKQGQWTRGENVMYLTFGRFAFTLGLAIMMHLNYTGYGNMINAFMSFGLWDILARLTYSAYLYHPIIIGIAYFNSSQYYHYDAIQVALKFLAFAVISFFVSMMSFLLVERPMMSLEKLFLPHGERAERKPKQEQIN